MHNFSAAAICGEIPQSKLVRFNELQMAVVDLAVLFSCTDPNRNKVLETQTRKRVRRRLSKPMARRKLWQARIHLEGTIKKPSATESSRCVNKSPKELK